MLTYQISPDGKTIKCLRCSRTSFNASDVETLYCNFCRLPHAGTVLQGTEARQGSVREPNSSNQSVLVGDRNAEVDVQTRLAFPETLEINGVTISIMVKDGDLIVRKTDHYPFKNFMVPRTWSHARFLTELMLFAQPRLAGLPPNHNFVRIDDEAGELRSRA